MESERDAQVDAAQDGFLALHPASVVLRIGKHARALLVPAIAVLFFARGGSWERWLAILFLPSVLFEVYRYATYRYRLGMSDLVIRRGLIFQSERHVPLARIQNVDLVQTAIQRLLRVAEVRVETAGGAAPEAVLSLLPLAAAEQLRAGVATFIGQSARAAEGGTPAVHGLTVPDQGTPVPCPVLCLGVRDLLLIGLLSNRGMAIIFVALGVLWEFDLLERATIRSVASRIAEHAAIAGPLAGVAMAGAALLLLRAFSIAWAILRFHGYRLERRENGLRLSCGLLTRVSATIPRRRIQLVCVRRTLLERILRRASIRIETAGGHGGDDNDSSHAMVSRRWFVPLVTTVDLPRVLAEVAPGLDRDFAEAEWHGLNRRGRFRMIRRGIMATLILLLVVVGFHLWRSPPLWVSSLATLLTLLPTWSAFRESAFIAIAQQPGRVLFRSGAWTHKRSAAFVEKIQSVSTTQSPFDRLARMATLRIDTAGAGPAEHVIAMPHQSVDDAGSLRDALASRAEAAVSGGEQRLK